MALSTNSITPQEIEEFTPKNYSRSEEFEDIDINNVIKGWFNLYIEFDKANELELRDESCEIIQGLIELRDNRD